MEKLVIHKRLLLGGKHDNFNIFTSDYYPSRKFAALKLETDIEGKLPCVKTFIAYTLKELKEDIKNNKTSGFSSFNTEEEALNSFNETVEELNTALKKNSEKFYAIHTVTKNNSNVAFALLKVDDDFKATLKKERKNTTADRKISLSSAKLLNNFFIVTDSSSELLPDGFLKVVNKVKETEKKEGYFEVIEISNLITDNDFNEISENPNVNWNEASEIVLMEDDFYLTNVFKTDYIETVTVSYVEIGIK